MPAASAVLLGAAGILGPSLEWRVVNDGVMGGVSSGRAEQMSEGGVRFTGELSLENNGGFASVRSAGTLGPLSGGDGLRVTVLGDGRTWQVTLRRDDVRIRAGSYRAMIQTEDGVVTTHELAWSDFEATSFGRPVPGAPPLWNGLDQVGSIGLLLADGRPGAFSVELQQVALLVDSSGAPPDAEARAAVQASLVAAVQLGVPAFNGGQPAVCAAHYQTALESAVRLGAAGLSVSEQRAIARALSTARTQDPAEAAWTYRRVIDAVLAR